MKPQPSLLDRQTDACRTCATPLADDQRYCLGCGERREEVRRPCAASGGEPRAAAAAPASPPVLSERPGGRGWTNAAVIASIGCLLLAMGVGVLIGRSATDDSTGRAAAPAQVITVEQAGGAPAAATATPAATTAPISAAAKKKAAADKRAAAAAASDAGASATSGGQRSTSKAVKDLQKLSPTEYQKKADKLPKTLGTGGKAPPKDRKAPAGGGDFEEIG